VGLVQEPASVEAEPVQSGKLIYEGFR